MVFHVSDVMLLNVALARVNGSSMQSNHIRNLYGLLSMNKYFLLTLFWTSGDVCPGF